MEDKKVLKVLNHLEARKKLYTKRYNELTKKYSDTDDENELNELLLNINHYESITEELSEIISYIENIL